MESKVGCDFPISIDRSYRGFLSYVFLKHDWIQNDPLEQATWEGVRLMVSFIIHFPAIWRGYRRFPDLDARIQRETARGNKVLLCDEGEILVLKLRESA